MSLTRVILCIVAVTSALASSQAQASTIYNRIQLTQFAELYPGEIVKICAVSSSRHVNVNALTWSLRRKDSRLKQTVGMSPNCRRYFTPAITGWDRVKVSFRHRGNVYVAMSYIAIRPAPPRP